MVSIVRPYVWKVVAVAKMGKQRKGVLRSLRESVRMPVTEVIWSAGLQHVILN